MQPKDCTFCGEPLPLPRNARQKMHKRCREKYWNDKRKEYPAYKIAYTKASKERWANITVDEKEKQQKQQRDLRRRQRKEVIEHYGGVCACCGEARIEFLAIDHINGGGAVHRKEIGGGSKIYRWLIHNRFPDGFRVLCHNCNMSYGFYGYCPHHLE